MTDYQQESFVPTSIHTISYKSATIEVPDDWKVHEYVHTVIEAPFSASGILDYTRDNSIDAGSGRSMAIENHDNLLDELKRNGETIERNICEDDSETVRSSVVYLEENKDGTTSECWVNVIYSDGATASFVGSIETSCTDSQKAEFAWVADSLRLVNLRGK